MTIGAELGQHILQTHN